MKGRRWIDLGLLVAVGLTVALLWPGVLESASREINEAILQGRSWVFTRAQRIVTEGAIDGTNEFNVARKGNGVVTPAVLENDTTTAAVGDGVALGFEAENSTQGLFSVGAFQFVTEDVVAGTEDSYLRLYTRQGGVNTIQAHLDGFGFYLKDGSQLSYEGRTGDTYGKRNPDTASVETTVDGVLSEQLRKNEWLPPDCVAGGPATFGGFCKDTGAGKIRYRDAAGVKELP